MRDYGTCPTCNKRHHNPWNWGDKAECLDCYIPRKIMEQCCK